MTDIFKKLNYKNQKPILILNHPETFQAEFTAISEETSVHKIPAADSRYSFEIAFTEMKSDLQKAAAILVKKAEKDAILWFAYPKQTSKKFKSDLNRDSVWETLAPLGLLPNRQIAIDEDWSALRFKIVQK